MPSTVRHPLLQTPCPHRSSFTCLDFRHALDSFEQVSTSMARVELDAHVLRAERNLMELKRQFDLKLNKKLNESNAEKTRNLELVRPTLAQPSRRNDLDNVDNQEKIRQHDLERFLSQLHSNTMVITLSPEYDREFHRAYTRTRCERMHEQRSVR